MGTKFIDGFEYGGTGTQQPDGDLWAFNSGCDVQAVDFKSGLYACEVNYNDSLVSNVFTWDATSDTLYMGFHVYVEGALEAGLLASIGIELGAEEKYYMTLYCVSSAGAIRTYAADSHGGVDLQVGSDSSTGVLQATAWHWIEMAFLPHQTTGVMNVWVDGTKITAVGTDSGDTAFDTGTIPNGAYAKVGIWPNLSTSTNDIFVDNVAVWDSDTTEANDPLDSANMGPFEVEGLLPTGDDGTPDFTRSAGSNNYETIDERPVSDADYNSSATVAHRDLFDYGNRAHTGTPLVVQLHTRASKTDTGTRTLSPILKGSSLEVQSAVTLVDSVFTQYVNVFPVDIDAGAWTNTKVNAIQAGYEVAS